MTKALSPFSLRLDRRTIARIRQLAAEQGSSSSAVVREAVARYEADPSPAEGRSTTALERLRGYVGIVTTGGAQHASAPHAHFRRLLDEKRRARRSR